MSTFIISCGGTGGHLSPGIALAEGLIERGHRCYLVISNKEVDSRLIRNYSHLEFIRVPGVGFSFNLKGIFLFLREQLKGLFFAARLLRKIRPDIVIGFGGFTTVGVSAVAYLLGCPIVLHEANRCAGKAIRLLSVLARRVYLPPGVRLKSLPPRTMRHFGYPVRKNVRPIGKHSACKKLDLKPDAKRLLVLGGSQGASVLNKWVLDNFEGLSALGINVYCVTGLGKCTKGKLEYVSENGELVQAIFAPFVDNMAEVLSCADLVVSRAGAGSIAEFSRCHIPSILVPYPFAADNHQEENANFFEKQGGGIVLKEKNLDQLYSEVVSMIFNDWLLNKFQQNLKSSEIQNSLKLIIDDIETLCAHDEPIASERELAYIK